MAQAIAASGGSAVSHAKRCVVQLGVYDREAGVLKNLCSGALLEGGLVLTAAHNVVNTTLSTITAPRLTRRS